MIKHLTIGQIEKISAYFASVRSSSTDERLSKDYRLAYLVANHLLDVKEELTKSIRGLEAALEVDPLMYSSESDYTEAILVTIRTYYNSLDHNYQD